MLELAPAGSRRAADRPHRRRQDAGRVPAEPGRAGTSWLDRQRLHTLYVSPLKALTTDIARNLTRPVEEMALPVRIETRTGDTPQNRRKRQRTHPPDMLLTTPESLALLLSYEDAAGFFGRPALRRARRVACAGRKQARRPVQPGPGAPAVGLAPRARFVGLSATVARADAPAALSVAAAGRGARSSRAMPAPSPRSACCCPRASMPWAGHMATYAAPRRLRADPRAQGHAGVRQHARPGRADVRRAVAAQQGQPADRAAPWQPRRRAAPQGRGRHGGGQLRAVVCTSSLDLGIDWGDVDLVVQVGAPKGAARLLQRIGRANHRLDEPSRAVLVPANRFEVLECIAAQDALAEHTLDGGALLPGRPRRAGAARHRRRLQRPVRCRRALRGGPAGGAVRRAGAGGLRRGARASSPPAAMRWPTYERYRRLGRRARTGCGG